MFLDLFFFSQFSIYLGPQKAKNGVKNYDFMKSRDLIRQKN